MDEMAFTLFFGKALIALAVAYGIGFYIRRKFSDWDFRSLRLFAVGFAILYTIFFVGQNGFDMIGGMLDMIEFFGTYLVAWAFLMGTEKRIIELWEFFTPAFYRKATGKPSPGKKQIKNENQKEF